MKDPHVIRIDSEILSIKWSNQNYYYKKISNEWHWKTNFDIDWRLGTGEQSIRLLNQFLDTENTKVSFY